MNACAGIGRREGAGALTAALLARIALSPRLRDAALEAVAIEEVGVSSTPNVWDEVFRRQGRVFHEPHEDLPAVVEPLRARGAATVLDLGSGAGRHLIALARQGFAVH